jgi:hypothetical protein
MFLLCFYVPAGADGEGFRIQESVNIDWWHAGGWVINQPILQIPNISYDCLNAIFALIIRTVTCDTFKFTGSEFAIDTFPLVFPRLRHSY